MDLQPHETLLRRLLFERAQQMRTNWALGVAAAVLIFAFGGLAISRKIEQERLQQVHTDRFTAPFAGLSASDVRMVRILRGTHCYEVVDRAAISQLLVAIQRMTVAAEMSANLDSQVQVVLRGGETRFLDFHPYHVSQDFGLEVAQCIDRIATPENEVLERKETHKDDLGIRAHAPKG